MKLLGAAPTGKVSTFYTAASLEKRQPEAYREDLTTVLKLLAQKEIEPVIGNRFQLTEAPAAHALLSRSSTGKIILTCSEPHSRNRSEGID